MSSFNALLLHISDQLTADQLYKVKYLYMDVLGKREAEKIFQGIQLFQCLVERGELSQHNTDLLSQRLKQIQRQDLSDKLDNFRTSDSTSSQPSQEEIAKLDIGVDVIAENLGRNWRKLGRKLGLNENKLESIAQRYPCDLEEMARQLLREWKKSRGAEVNTAELIKALRECQQNLTADILEEKIKCM
ncbi:protein FADD isoform X1 [Nerophis ophidion]|uniref:protein FADD isoform X1 n=1 Tax=Nerophis ophidion TaxID=159077 RepID=UPI002ADFA629|nr:protein FADD isoform X1 [Nerophis ophidion]